MIVPPEDPAVKAARLKMSGQDVYLRRLQMSQGGGASQPAPVQPAATAKPVQATGSNAVSAMFLHPTSVVLLKVVTKS